MEIRKLETNDIYPMSKILKKMNLKIDVYENKSEGIKKTQEQLGAEVILSVFENMHMAQKEINEFMGSFVGLSGEEFGKLPIEESMNVIDQFRKLPQLANFLSLAGRLTR